VPDKIIDLRSDTVTRPTPAMRAAMAAAEVDDDVVGADPTVARLQERIAVMLGKEAAIYMPSGTMTNQVAVRLHCSPGDELICEEGCHIFNYEQGGYAQLSGIAARPVYRSTSARKRRGRQTCRRSAALRLSVVESVSMAPSRMPRSPVTGRRSSGAEALRSRSEMRRSARSAGAHVRDGDPPGSRS